MWTQSRFHSIQYVSSISLCSISTSIMWTPTICMVVRGKHMEQKLQLFTKQQARGCYLTFQNRQLLFLNKSQTWTLILKHKKKVKQTSQNILLIKTINTKHFINKKYYKFTINKNWKTVIWETEYGLLSLKWNALLLLHAKNSKKSYKVLGNFCVFCLAFCSEARLSSISSHCNFIKHWLFL